MQINKSVTVLSANSAKYSVLIDCHGATRELWYSVDREYAGMISDSADAALLGLLLPAMLSGEDIHINAAVSSELLWNMQLPFQNLMIEAIPYLNKITISAKETFVPTSNPDGVSTGFSGGIDTYCTISEYLSEKTPPHLRLTHLVFNNVGSHGSYGEKSESLFNERCEKLKLAAINIGLPFIRVESNLHSFYNKKINFELTNTLRNASAVAVLQNKIKTHLYSSSYGLKDLSITNTKNMAYFDFISFSYLSSENIRFVSSGAHLSRVEKSCIVADYENSFASLNVCTKSADNCSMCSKCLRTLLTFDIANCLNRYSTVFNLETYGRLRTRYISQVIVSHDSFCREIREFAKLKGYKFPFASYLLIPFTAKAVKKTKPIYFIGKFFKNLKIKIRQ